jgi:DNA recombination protein RmuC
MFERLCILSERWSEVGSCIENSVKAYNRSVSSLESRLKVTARKFKELGAGTEGQDVTDMKQIGIMPKEVKTQQT